MLINGGVIKSSAKFSEERALRLVMGMVKNVQQDLKSVLFLYTHCEQKSDFKGINTVLKKYKRDGVNLKKEPDLMLLVDHMLDSLAQHKDKLIIIPAEGNETADPKELLDLITAIPPIENPRAALCSPLSLEAQQSVEYGCKEVANRLQLLLGKQRPLGELVEDLDLLETLSKNMDCEAVSDSYV
eukprot:COSAG03_NODE_11594_length_585_cov_0.701646_1_plen_184_part_01